jgi:hypothetical protein
VAVGPATDFFCPVCGLDRQTLNIWQEPASDRIRIFCNACRLTGAYRNLSADDIRSLGRREFEAFAAGRLLRSVYEKEHGDRR